MPSARKSEASRINGAKSRGPKTAQGCAISSRNATTHGLRSERPLIPGEDPAEWDAFRADNISILAPANSLERELAELVGAYLARDRVAQSETPATAPAGRAWSAPTDGRGGESPRC